MYRVYWSMPDLDSTEYPRNFEPTVVDFKDFGDNEMSEALECVANCRKSGYSFVTMVAGNVPGMVGQMGVTPAPADYAWTKRRHNERGEGGVIRKYLKLTDEVEVPHDDER